LSRLSRKAIHANAFRQNIHDARSDRFEPSEYGWLSKKPSRIWREPTSPDQRNAVDQHGQLTDYKVIVLTIDEDHVSERLQDLLKDDNNQLKVDDAARIIGCWKALSKQGLRGELGNDITPMQRAVAFCQVIEPSTGKAHKVSSKQISEIFQSVIDAYQSNTKDRSVTLRCEAAHVDGSMNAMEK
jgi:predicted helicase